MRTLTQFALIREVERCRGLSIIPDVIVDFAECQGVRLVAVTWPTARSPIPDIMGLPCFRFDFSDEPPEV